LSHFETVPYADDEFQGASDNASRNRETHFALSSCGRLCEALGQMASGDGDNKLAHFRGEKAEQ
jgi:hypothetical protein